MVNQKFDSLDLEKNEESLKDGKKDLNVLNLKEQEQTKSYDKLDGTGVNALRTISGILIVLGVIMSIAGIVQIANEISYHPERMYMGMVCFYIAVSCFVLSPVFKVLATIGEAAKIYLDKNKK
jgi:hypothetical protein